MKNVLTYRVESSLGAVFISLLSLFFIGLMFIAVKNFESDIDVMSAIDTSSGIKTAPVSKTEVALIQEWVKINSIVIPEGSGFRYLLRKYPDRPWL
jgi:hypothetical protein